MYTSLNLGKELSVILIRVKNALFGGFQGDGKSLKMGCLGVAPKFVI